MKAIITVCSCAFVLTGCGGGSQQDTNQTTSTLPSEQVIKSFDPQVIVSEGDSLTAISSKTYWPNTVRINWKARWENLAVGGSTTSDIVNRYAKVQENKPSSGRTGVFILNAGSNDAKVGCTPAVNIAFQNLKDLWTWARADGFKVVAFTIRFWGEDAVCEAERVRLNTLIRTNNILYDALIETETIFPDVNDSSLFYDKLHYTAAGNDRVAAAVQKTLESLK